VLERILVAAGRGQGSATRQHKFIHHHISLLSSQLVHSQKSGTGGVSICRTDAAVCFTCIIPGTHFFNSNLSRLLLPSLTSCQRGCSA
jgi:hypothetical protein